jgi:hypothetical protein
MAIDYTIEYGCVPRQKMMSDGILERLKGQERAASIIKMYRDAGDDRPPSEMGFEFTFSTPQQQNDTVLVNVQHVLDDVADLDLYAHHCQNCPANRTGKPYGCAGFIQYPISAVGETWLLNQLPGTDAPLVWLLLKQGVENFMYDGSSIKALRQNASYFEKSVAPARHMGDFLIDANQVFEMIFAVGDIQPNHAGVLLLFFNVMPRNVQANDIMHIAPAPADAARKMPFLLDIKPNDDPTIYEFKAFFHALYLAWLLNVPLKVDA